MARTRVSDTVYGIDHHGAWGDFVLTEENAAIVLDTFRADDGDLDLTEAMCALERMYPWLAECGLYSFDPDGCEIAYQGLCVDGLQAMHPGVCLPGGWDEDDPNVCDPTAIE